jgi:hypothetical protein
MNRRPAPAAATWLLRIFCSDPEYDSVIGDLLEQHQLGRSHFWYGRQVLGILVFGLYGKARGQGSTLFLLLGTVFAAALCAWAVFLVLDIGGVFATIVPESDVHDTGYPVANWFGLLFFVSEIALAAFCFYADRRKQKK